RPPLVVGSGGGDLPVPSDRAGRVSLSLTVNGRLHRLDVEPAETLLRVLRERLHLLGTKEGCVEGECGACTVLIDGRPIDSCLVAALAVEGAAVTTIEGVGNGGLSAIQEAMARTGGVQCGFCTPGFVMTLTALLADVSQPTEEEVRLALAGNICRCTGYSQIVDAALAATAITP
ncbi:MAG TPA: (2Fe-2S)-binding protein, partial [Acidimicrobiia bacterium]|nr:(2Fe-2S)-binding protein [Acidimicrobiia bacterium]